LRVSRRSEEERGRKGWKTTRTRTGGWQVGVEELRELGSAEGWRRKAKGRREERWRLLEGREASAAAVAAGAEEGRAVRRVGIRTEREEEACRRSTAGTADP